MTNLKQLHKHKINFAFGWLMLGLLIFFGYGFYYFGDTAKYLLVVVFYLLLAALIKFTEMSLADLGLQWKQIKKGALYTLPLAALIFIVAFIIYLIAPQTFSDGRYDYSNFELFLKLFILLPLTTVFLEEVTFRSLLPYLFNHVFRLRHAIFVSSLAFGFWHLLTARAITGNALASSFGIGQILIIGGVIAVTTIAGLALSYIRFKTDSLAAPIILHWALNASGILMAFIAAQ